MTATTQNVEADPTITEYDYLHSRDAVNAAIFGNGMAIRIMPPAPRTEVYFACFGGSWMKREGYNGYWEKTDVETVRRWVNDNISKNYELGGGGVKAVELDGTDKVAYWK